MTEDFSKYPTTIGEAKKTDNAADWTPRDALINVLRDIDEGVIKPTALVVSYYDSNSDKSGFRNASPNLTTTMGMLEMTKINAIGRIER